MKSNIKKALILALGLSLSSMTSVNSADRKDLDRIISVCWEKGTNLGLAPASYIEKVEQKGDKERRLYFTMVYGLDKEGVGASQVYTVEEEWKKVPGGTEIDHSNLDDEWFNNFKDMERYVIEQKIIFDGGEYGELDGKPDYIEVKTKTITVKDGWVIDIKYHPTPKPEEVQKTYDSQVKEMLKVADDIEK
ncbi:MAG: hypothetical protein Q8O03_09300 [Nanoarchaeota archaeon]|nr:hypothetical protein [Nanoarchaeota archaeon]